jgi:hypothetical protein
MMKNRCVTLPCYWIPSWRVILVVRAAADRETRQELLLDRIAQVLQSLRWSVLRRVFP